MFQCLGNPDYRLQCVGDRSAGDSTRNLPPSVPRISNLEAQQCLRQVKEYEIYQVEPSEMNREKVSCIPLRFGSRANISAINFKSFGTKLIQSQNTLPAIVADDDVL